MGKIEKYGSEFRAAVEGTIHALWLIPLYLPLALAFTITAQAVGISSMECTIWTVFNYAGTSQLACVSILALNGGLFVAMMTTFFINLRQGFVSLSLAGHLSWADAKTRLLLGFLMTTPMVGLIPARVKQGGGLKSYWLATALCQYVQWILFTLLGLWLGQFIPQSWDQVLWFVAPATYIALAMPLIMNDPGVGTLVAISAMLTGTALAPVLGSGLGTVVAAVIGAAIGLAWKMSKR